jgi:hypothetical protein
MNVIHLNTIEQYPLLGNIEGKKVSSPPHVPHPVRLFFHQGIYIYNNLHNDNQQSNNIYTMVEKRENLNLSRYDIGSQTPHPTT